MARRSENALYSFRKKTTEELTSTALVLDPVLVNWCHNRGIDSTVFKRDQNINVLVSLFEFFILHKHLR